jgi:hypothetical protein
MKRILLAAIACMVLLPLTAMPPRYYGPHFEVDLPTQILLRRYVPWASLGITPPTSDTEMGGPMGVLIDQIPWIASITSVPNTGGIFETGTNGARGGGVSISINAQVISFSTTLAYGIGWSYEIVTESGRDVIKLKYTVSTPLNGSTSGGIIVTPEMLGLDPEETAYNVVTGRYDVSTINKLRNAGLVSNLNNAWVTAYDAWTITITTSVYP